MAVLDEKIDSLTKTVDSSCAKQDELMKTVIQNQINIKELFTRQEGLEGDVDGLEKRVNTWGSLNTIFAAIAGLFGHFSK